MSSCKNCKSLLREESTVYEKQGFFSGRIASSVMGLNLNIGLIRIGSGEGLPDWEEAREAGFVSESFRCVPSELIKLSALRDRRYCGLCTDEGRL